MWYYSQEREIMEISQKSVLAKLLATENVSIEHQKVSTASFDLKNRKIILPIWNDMSNELYNLLIGHEVSHALNTPLEGLHDALCERGSNFKGFLNIIEDARIERKIKKQYPGLVKDFYTGYRELFSKGFFGDNKDVQEMSLIDRINLHYKIGNLLGITFTDAEKVYLDRIDNAETWDDVVAIASDIYDGELEEQDQNKDYNYEPDENDDSDGDGQSVEASSSDTESKEEEDVSDESDDTDEESEEEQTAEDTIDHDKPFAETDEAFRANENKLLKRDAKEIFYATFPTNIKSEKFVTDISKVWDTNFENCYTTGRIMSRPPRVQSPTHNPNHHNSGTYLDYKPFALARQAKFDKKNSAYINQMVQLFEMRRRASALSKARENKTGELNMNKLWATRLTEDVFLSNTVVPDGKNHGMMLFLDFSGSMNEDMAATLEQVMIQIQFCKKVNIPFDVYSFTDGISYEPMDKDSRKIRNSSFHGGLKEGNLYISSDRNVQINHLISSSCGSAQYKSIITKMFTLIDLFECNGWDNEYTTYRSKYSVPDQFRTGGTPLGATTMIARNLIRNFKVKNKTEIMNVIFLTDGGATDELEISGTETCLTKSRIQYGDKFVLTENGVTTVHENDSLYYFSTSDVHYRVLLKHLKETVGCNLINFHIGAFSKHEIMNMLSGDGEYYEAENRYKKEFLKNKFIELENYNSFDVFYAIKNGDNLKIDDEELTVKSNNKGDLVRGFKKFQKNKSQSRVFLNKFIDKVA